MAARQRAMLILRDVLEWPAAEVATLLDTTTTAVNSGLRRARAQVSEAMPEYLYGIVERKAPTPSGNGIGDSPLRLITDDGAAALVSELQQREIALGPLPWLSWVPLSGRRAVWILPLGMWSDEAWVMAETGRGAA